MKFDMDHDKYYLSDSRIIRNIMALGSRRVFPSNHKRQNNAIKTFPHYNQLHILKINVIVDDACLPSYFSKQYESVLKNMLQFIGRITNERMYNFLLYPVENVTFFILLSTYTEKKLTRLLFTNDWVQKCLNDDDEFFIHIPVTSCHYDFLLKLKHHLRIFYKYELELLSQFQVSIHFLCNVPTYNDIHKIFELFIDHRKYNEKYSNNMFSVSYNILQYFVNYSLRHHSQK